MSVVGFDDSRLLPFLDPPLTTLRQPVAEMAMQAVDTLCSAIVGQPLPSHDYLFKPELVLRAPPTAPPRRGSRRQIPPTRAPMP